MSKRIVIALGGNALGSNLEEQMKAVKNTAVAIADLIEECMDKFKEKSNMELTIDNIITVDKEVREYLRKKVS